MKLDGVQNLDSLNALLRSINLSSGKQATEFATAVSNKLELGAKKISVSFLKDLLRASCESLSEEEVAEILGVVTVIKNEKTKAKMAKKKGGPKPKLNTRGLDNLGGDRYDMDAVDERGRKIDRGFDDGDFM